MPCPLLNISQSDFLLQIADTNVHTEWQTVHIKISWHLKKPTDLDLHSFQMFVLRFYGPVNPMRFCPVPSVYLTTLLLGRLTKQLTSIMQILSSETDKCLSWIRWRERMTIENISWSISMKEYCRPGRDITGNLLITITKTYLYNFDPLKPHFYIVKLGFAGV